jgi:hypothetical protein
MPHMRAHVCARIRAQTCEPFPLAWTTACDSARRRSPRLRRSTETSARGTPLASPLCPGYAPLFGRRRATAADALGRSSMRRGGTADARAHTYRHSLGRVSTCVCMAARRRRWNICMQIYPYISTTIGRVCRSWNTHIYMVFI